MTKLRFEELNLSGEILDAVRDMGFEEASPIQAETIPVLLKGKDIIGQAQTGTGKTAAFAIPVIEKIDPDSRDLQALILCPTRELVIQVSEEFRKLIKYKENLSIVPVYGGQQIDRQLRALKKGVQIIIGTPGRTMDHMRRGSIKIDSVKMVVLDEADEMLDMGFREDIEVILKDSSEDRQTIMFSATMAQDIIELTKKYQKEPVIVDVTHKKVNSPKIQQTYFEVQDKNKPEVLARLIDLHNIKLALVFCNTRSQVDLLVEILKTRGYFADALHGDMSQNQRDRVMNGFRNGTVEILVATDVAGRGIDVNDVEAVFNYDLPRDDEDYTHRIGRTARAGKTGAAFTFVTGKQVYNLKRIERANGVQIQRQNVPTMDELEATRISSYKEKIAEIIEQGHLSKFINQAEYLMGEDHTSLDVAAALIKLIMEKENEGFDHSVDLNQRFSDFKSIEDKYSRNTSRNRSDKPNNFRKNKPRNEENRFKSSDKKKARSFKDDKPFSDEKRKNNKKSEFEYEFKPKKRKTDSGKDEFKKNEFKKSEFRKDEFRKEDRPSNFSRKSNKNSSFKEAKPYKEKSNQKNNKPAKKFGKNN